MVKTDTDDIKAWLQELQKRSEEESPFAQLKRFREGNPGAPIPEELEFASRCEPIVGGEDGSISYEHELAIQIDRWIAKDDARKGGGVRKEWRQKAFERVVALTEIEGKTQRQAIDKTLDELTSGGIEDDTDNFERSFQRYVSKLLVDQIGQAISHGDEMKAIALLGEFRRRYNTFGCRWTAA